MHHNWKKECGMTMRQAKVTAREKLGRLPHPGYEITVFSEIKEHWVTQEWDGKKVFIRSRHSICLYNRAGTFELYEHWLEI